MSDYNDSDSKAGPTITVMFLIILGLFFAWTSADSRANNLQATNEELTSEIESARETIAELEGHLDEANSNIDAVNANITDAQAAAWESYDEMGEALENLTTADTIIY